MLKFVLKSSLKVFILVVISVPAFSQTTDTTSAPKKPIPKIEFQDDRLFNGIRVGIDVAGIAYGYMTKDDNYRISNRYEINGDFGIKRYFVTLDLGTGTYQRWDTTQANSTYKSEGQYFRLGGDYRISKSAKSFLFFGGRFGKSFFTETGDVNFRSEPGRPDAHFEINRKLSANWLEMATGMKVFIWKNFYMGYTLHFKLLLKTKKIKEEQPLDIPGFGAANKANNLGMSFHLMYRIPFGKDPVVPLK
jgi:hypothetical protein